MSIYDTVMEQGMVRLRPFLIAAAVALATALPATFGHAGERLQLAQKWTPLTGVLTPDGETPEPQKDSEPQTEPEPQKQADIEPPKPTETPADSPPTSKLNVRAVLARATTDGQPHGSLGIRTMSIDADLADGLGLGSERGALVSEVPKSSSGEGAGLKAGDVIQKIDGNDVAGADALAQALRSTNPEQQITVDIWRAGEGTDDFKRLLTSRSDAGNVGAAASLGRLLSLGLVLGPKNLSEAADYYLKAAEAGHLASMTRYALFAKDGIGIPRNDALAAKWFLKAAEGGHEAAMTNLGTLYETGRGAKQDFAEAARWYRKAADKGHVFAMHKLALLYEAGRGVEKNDAEAVSLLRQASEKGLSEATSWLADKYEQGRGIPKNENEALRLNQRAADQVRKAAEQGNAVATFNLGILYRIGKGVKRSDSEAAYWVVKSLKLGDKYLVSELIRNPSVLALADRKWLQEVLRDEGAYKGPINGSFTPDVRTAMESLGEKT